MSNLYDNTFNVKQVGYNSTMPFRITVDLDAQDDVNLTSDLVFKLWVKRGSSGGSYPSYENNRVGGELKGKDSVNTTLSTLIARKTIAKNTYSSWTEVTDLRYTHTYSHKADGTLSVEYQLAIDHGTSTSGFVPINTTLKTGTIVVPAFEVLTYSVLDDIPDTEMCDGVRCTFTAAASATKHKLQLFENGVSIASVEPYESGAKVGIYNQANRVAKMTSGRCEELTATLTTYNGATVLGTSSKNFNLYGDTIWVKDNGEWKPGLIWVKVSGTWKPGVMKIKDGIAWKEGKV